MSNLEEQRQLEEQEQELVAYLESLADLDLSDEDYLPLPELDSNEKEPSGSILDLGRGLIG